MKPNKIIDHEALRKLLSDLNALNNLNALKYEGYLWLSDKPAPFIIKKGFNDLNGQTLPTLGELEGAANPFIIEGQLYDADNKLSYSIRYADGETLVTCFELSKMEQDENLEMQDKTFLPSHMEGVSSLCFKDVWEAEADPLCCNMEVLQPRALVFVGFDKKTDDHAK